MARIHNQSLTTSNEPNSITTSSLHSSSDIQPENLRVKAEEALHDDTETSSRRIEMTDDRRISEENKDDGVKEKEESGRERLVRYRSEVAGRVCVPEIWDQEHMLEDWIHCSSPCFDASLVASSLLSARSALVEEAKRSRSSSSGLRIANNYRT